MSEILQDIIKNRILKNLPREDFESLAPRLKQINLVQGQILYKPYQPIEQVYFPNSAMISVVSETKEGQSVEIGVIGREGIAGISVLLGSETMPNTNNVQLPGDGFQISVADIKSEFNRAGALHESILRYVYVLMIQIAQTAVCNRLHSVEERLARWLLMSRDRADSDELRLTQEFIAMMLGTNRSSVTLASITLQNVGYIRYLRGKILIVDHEGLKEFACDCYRIVKDEYERLN